MDFTTKIFKTSKVIFVIFLIFFAVRLAIYHYNLIVFPYPDMLREGAMMTSTDALVKGLNPYAFGLQPQHTNVYGIIYPLLMWPLALIFGTTLLIHRIVVAFFIFASCAFVFVVLKKMQVPSSFSLWAVLMLYASLLYPGTSTPCVDPASMGLFLLLLTVFIPWFCGYSYKSLVISIFCGILAFYTKQYTMLGLLMTGSYVFFFISRLKGLFYGLGCLLLAAISVALVNHLLPAYFDNCFFISANMAHAWSSIERLHQQIHIYGQLHQWVFILIGAQILWYIALFGVKFLSLRAQRSNLLKDCFVALRAPRNDILLVLFAGCWACIVLYKSLGRHSGALMWYFFQLLSPFFLITAAWAFSRKMVWSMVCIPFLIYNLYVMTLKDDYKQFDKNSANWPEVSKLISQHQHILNSSLIVPLLIAQNKEYFDNGMSEYFGSGGKRPLWIKPFVPDDPNVEFQLTLFFIKIRGMVENKEFDLILLQPSLMPMGVDDDIRKYYKCFGQILLYAPQDNRPYALTLWLPD